MLYGVFYWVINISIAATVAGILIALLRRIKFVPRRFSYALWGIVFLRFVTPFMVSSSLSFMNLLTRLGTKTVVVAESSEKIINISDTLSKTTFTTTNCVQFADEYFPIVYSETVYRTEKINTLINIFEKSALIWAVIAAAALITLGVLYYFTTRELRNAVHYKDNIYICESVVNPCVCGIFKYRIIIPCILDEKTLAFVTSHENVHIKRKDNLRRIFVLIVACLHWFNPCIWLFLRAYFMDMELSCDYMAIKKLDNDGRKEYARTLLAFAPSKQTVLSSTFSGSKIKLRIENVLAYKALSTLSAFAFSAFAIIIAITILTNAG